MVRFSGSTFVGGRPDSGDTVSERVAPYLIHFFPYRLCTGYPPIWNVCFGKGPS